MPESLEDQISRVEMMSEDDGQTWDLSVKDKAALKAVLAKLPLEKAAIINETWSEESIQKHARIIASNIECASQVRWTSESHEEDAIRNIAAGLKKKPVSDYDSAPETLKHIARVGDFLAEFAKKIVERASRHDHSKLLPPEKEAFDIATPRLRNLTYGSPEYKASLNSIRPAIDHHQSNNTHHPEAYDDGINGMDLVDLIEMMADWKSAGERHENGNIGKSLEINKERFNISDQLYDVLCNTAIRMGWL